jgi:hypothetical protein
VLRSEAPDELTDDDAEIGGEGPGIDPNWHGPKHNPKPRQTAQFACVR